MDCLKLQQKCDALVACIREKDEEISKLKEELSILNQSVPSIEKCCDCSAMQDGSGFTPASPRWRKEDIAAPLQRETHYVHNTSTRREEMLHISGLPDEMLLKIFAFLDTDTLVNAVDVCRNWRRIGCDKTLWLEIRLSVPSKREDCVAFARAFSKAPCLLLLIIDVHVVEHCPSYIKDLLLFHSPAAVILKVTSYRSWSWFVLLLLHRHIRSVRALLIDGRFNGKYRDEFWRAVNQMKLTCLDIADHTLDEESLTSSCFEVSSRVCAGSIQRLFLQAVGVVGPVVASLIRANRDTLEQVSLPQRTPDSVVSLLAGCSRLRQADLSVSQGLSSLKVCSRLSTLSLRDWHCVKDLTETADLLRESGSLKQLQLFGMRGGDLLRAVARSRSVLRQLIIHHVDDGLLLLGLVDVLRCQPHLEELVVDRLLPREVLDAFTPAMCPKLTRLQMFGSCCSPFQLAPEDCFEPTVIRLVERNPGLSVMGFTCYLGFYNDEEDVEEAEDEDDQGDEDQEDDQEDEDQEDKDQADKEWEEGVVEDEPFTVACLVEPESQGRDKELPGQRDEEEVETDMSNNKVVQTIWTWKRK